MTARVACVGGAVMDLVYGVDRLPGEDGKSCAISYAEMGGGMAANAAVSIVRLGGAASWWGLVGEDEKGSRILEGLRQEAVDIEHARVVRNAVSSHSLVLVDRAGNRAIILYRPGSLDDDASSLPLERVSAFDAVLADNRWIDGAVAVLSEARKRGLVGLLDADAGAGAHTIKAVRCASHAVFSKNGLLETYGTSSITDALAEANRQAPFVAVTLGADGLQWRCADGRGGSLVAFEVDAIETVGAGDVFHGAFALALAEGQEEEAALRFAAAAAALKCSGRGGRASFPSRQLVEELVLGGN